MTQRVHLSSPDDISSAARGEIKKMETLSAAETSLGDSIQQILDKSREIFELDVLTLLLFRKVRSVTLNAPSGPEVRLMDQGWSRSIEPWLISSKDEETYQTVAETLQQTSRELLTPLLADRKIVVISDLEKGWVHPQRFTQESLPLKSLIFIPLVIEGELFAGLLGAWTQKRQISPVEIKAAEMVGNQMIMVFRTARLQNSLQAQVDRLQALLEVSSVIYSSLDYQAVLEKVIHHAKNLAGADGCTIYLLDHQQQVLLPLLTNYEEYYDQIMGFRLRLGEGVTGKVAQTGLGIISNYAEADTRTVQIPGTPEEPESIISVPLMWSGDVIGVITINAKGHKRFREEDLNLLTIFARLVADALENSRLYEDLEKAYKELTDTQEQLVRSERLRALGEMAGGVAHDFNNILGSILGRAQLLMKVTEDPKLQQGLKIIEQSASDGAEVVRRIQEFTRVHKGSNFDPVDMNQIVEDVIEQTKPMWKDQAQRKGIYIQVNKELKPCAQVEGIASELREVLANVILNSIDALPQGGNIDFQTFQDQRQVYIRVSDSGVGMPEDVRKKIFDPFFTTKGKKGTGLGLSVAYGIISRHKGEIVVESGPGKGTAMLISFPKASDQSPEVAPASAQRLDHKLKILVVDDDENIRTILNDILSLDGHRVSEAESGFKAMEIFAPEKFDLVVTDLGMPGMSGWEVAKGIKDKSPSTPVILISGWGGQIDSAKLKESKIDFMLSKPFNIEQIRSVLFSATQGQPVAS
jgi:signal transduction histidine kinase/ActR/RegA family two-component response regulator